MADIRIKDLTTTASSSASDDFIAIDGTTNGTRKLNAFSPTFGGNATVTGTLTANGNIVAGGNVICGSATNQSVSIAGGTANDGGNIIAYGSTHASDPNTGRIRIGTTTIALWDSNDFSVASGKGLKVLATTASTTTSTGALVVSGGVGVGGAINAGGTITSVNGSGSGLLGMRSSSGNASYVFWSETGVADRGILGFNNGSSTLSYRSFSSSFSTGTEVFSITSAGVVSIPATTASTSTSSGALVVSGGVGVAGAIYAANLGGTSTNNNAASGCIGEYASATTAYASKVSLTSNTAANIVSISLTAGDWDVQFNPVFTQDTSLTTSGVLAGVSSSSGVLPSGAAERAHSPSGPNGNSDLSIAPPVTRISLASTTTIYGVATGIFSAGTMSAYGFIRARRVR